MAGATRMSRSRLSDRLTTPTVTECVAAGAVDVADVDDEDDERTESATAASANASKPNTISPIIFAILLRLFLVGTVIGKNYGFIFI